MSIEGRVRRRGVPVAGALVTFALKERAGGHGGRLTVEAGPTGKYHVRGLWPGTYGVMVHVGEAGLWRPDLEVSPPSFMHDIDLGDHNVEVRVVDGADRPLSGVRVFAHADGRQISTFDAAPTTDADGVATMRLLSPGIYTFSPSIDAGLVERPRVTITEDGGSVRVTAKASWLARLVVQVVDAEGRPSPAYIRLVGVGSKRLPDVGRFTDESGRAEYHVRPGEWLVGLDSVPVRKNEEERFIRFARRVAAESDAIHPILLVKPPPR